MVFLGSTDALILSQTPEKHLKLVSNLVKIGLGYSFPDVSVVFINIGEGRKLYILRKEDISRIRHRQ